ncbi:prolyl oligopeptidase family serine peptidase [soil metagenome]
MTATAPPDTGQVDDLLMAHMRGLAVGLFDTLGYPRTFALSTDGARLCYLQARSGADHRHALWMVDGDAAPVLMVDPDELGDDATMSDAERARRERTREQASGITAYAATPDLESLTFAHDARLHVVSTADRALQVLDVPGPVTDPRPSPTGRHIAWVADGRLHVADTDGGNVRELAGDPDPDVTWGLAEFIAAEEMGRQRGFWWAPDGNALAVCRVDTSAVQRWWLHEPITPAAPPQQLRYPAAGTTNATVTLAVLGLDGSRTDVAWDRARLPYLAAVRWQAGAPLTLAVQQRDQRRVDILTVDRGSGQTRTHRTITGDPWVELVPGTPGWTPDGRLVTVEDDLQCDTRRVHVDGAPRSPAGLHVGAVLSCGSDGIVVAGSGGDPTARTLWLLPDDDGDGPRPLTATDGVHGGIAASGTTVVHTEQADDTAVTTRVLRDGAPALELPQIPIDARVAPRPQFASLTDRGLRAALLLPSWYTDGPLPVLLDPYGGPHAQRVRQSARGFLASQWFAEAGLAVLVIDGRGTPGRGLAWEHAVHTDLATPALQDQERGLRAAATHWPLLDLDRVAIRGWSFGGYLAALAVLRRPDVFHAAIAGAPVTDWRRYDTHYTERYLGHPDTDPGAYDRSSLLADAVDLRRQLLLLHGLADDNVVAAHSVALSDALLAAGRPHRLLPLSATTHMTRDPVRRSGLLEIQLRFIRTAIGLAPRPASSNAAQ